MVKSLAELKRRLQPGSQLLAVEHWRPEMVLVIRTVTKVQSNGYWFTCPIDKRESWSDFGKASEYTFTHNGFRYERNGRGWTLEFV